jgi:integrase/recombinase XerD
MLTLFRRHLKACKFTGRKHRNCQCPLAVEGMLHGRKVRKSLDIRSWDAAQKMIREWESNPTDGILSVAQACEKFMADARARMLSEGMLRKLTHVTNELSVRIGLLPLRSVTVDDVRSIREGWQLGAHHDTKAPGNDPQLFPLLRRLWLDRPQPSAGRPAADRATRADAPFTAEQMEKILWAADTIREIHYQMNEGIEKKMRALVLLMRYSGLRISDAVTLSPDRIQNNKLFLYQTKTKQPVWIPLLAIVLDALKEIDEGRAYYFWSGNSQKRHAPTEWQDRLKKLFRDRRNP